MTGKIGRAAFRPGDYKLHAGAPDTMPAGWTLADHRIADIADYPRLYAAVGQAWRLGGDVYDTGLQFRIPDGTRLFRGATWTAAVAGLSYPLDALFAELSGAPGYFAGKLTMTGADQLGTYTASGALGAPVIHAATAADFSAGTSATLSTTLGAPQDIEFVITAPDLTAVPGAGTALYASALLLDSTTFATLFKVEVEASAASGLVNFGYYGPGGPIASENNIAAGAHRITLEIDSSLGQIQICRNGGAPLVLSDDTFPAAVALALLQVQENAGTDAALAGAVVSLELVTDAADILYPITAGATDFGGATIGGGGASSDVGTRAGSATSGGHVLTLAELPSDALTGGYQGAGTSGSAGASLGDGRDFIDTAVPLTLGGSDAAHDHTIDPEHVKVLVLVKT